jgi:hypothetical protein
VTGVSSNDLQSNYTTEVWFIPAFSSGGRVEVLSCWSVQQLVVPVDIASNKENVYVKKYW